MASTLNLTDQRFGRLVAKELLGREKGHTWWLCACDCGESKKVSANALRRGLVKSCGCLRRDLAHTRTAPGGPMDMRTHGMRKSHEYGSWRQLLNRCQNKKAKDYPRYGGRGITVDERWLVFENFLADMGSKPGPEYSVEREDNDGPYASWNCRWATRSEQQRNTRRNRKVTFLGETAPLVVWAERLGVSWDTLATWIRRGWSESKMLYHAALVVA